MSLAADFRPAAVDDVIAARRWYEEQEPGLADSFADSIYEIVDRIKSIPRMYQEVLPSVRRGKLRRFPYLVYYRVLADRFEILAVLHGSRDPKLWRDRIN